MLGGEGGLMRRGGGVVLEGGGGLGGGERVFGIGSDRNMAPRIWEWGR